MRIVTLKKGERVLVAQCKVADGFFSRFFGLMGKKSLASTEAVAFPNCNSIHTFFMRMPIDVLFLSSEGKVVEVLNAFLPWRLVLPQKQAKHTIEMQAGNAAKLGISVGDLLKLEGVC